MDSVRVFIAGGRAGSGDFLSACQTSTSQEPKRSRQLGSLLTGAVGEAAPRDGCVEVFSRRCG